MSLGRGGGLAAKAGTVTDRSNDPRKICKNFKKGRNARDLSVHQLTRDRMRGFRRWERFDSEMMNVSSSKEGEVTWSHVEIISFIEINSNKNTKIDNHTISIAIQ